MEPDRDTSSPANAAGGDASGSSIGPQPSHQTADDLRAGGAVAGGGVRGGGEWDGTERGGADRTVEHSPAVRREWWRVAAAGFRRAVRLGDAEGKDITITVQPIHLRTGTGRRVIVLDPMGMDDLRAAIVSARLLVLGLTLLLLAVGGYIMRLHRERDERET
jgi:hypothetical protein